MTKEVIRDYFEEFANNEFSDLQTLDIVPLDPPRPFIPDTNTSKPESMEPRRSVTSQGKFGDSSSPTSEALELPLGTPSISNDSLFFSPQTSDSNFEDGIFLPGSQYQELSATLRSRLIDTARSTAPSRLGSPEVDDRRSPLSRTVSAESEYEESRRLAELSVEQEFVLWQNYIQEVASWLDKFDICRHFELVLPVIAKSHPHLRYSILAISARQVELRSQSADYALSLALYQHAIHLLSPLLQERTTVVLASCVVLCVLEMMSCSPKAWKRHLDGCAALIQALGITGDCGGLEQALFWCFARMDICGGLISSEKTLIPIHKWMSSGDISLDHALIETYTSTFDMYANCIVFLCGRVVDLLCRSGKWEQRRGHPIQAMDSISYLHEWSRLFELIERWYHDRSEEMHPLFTIHSPSSSSRPFPTLFFGNAPATSGNQMYHTAALLMLKHRPLHVQFARKPHSLLWHARQICAISMSNDYHSCWTNSIQPLWIAGQQMSHSSEHRAILEIYERIERETGFATKWRADDLLEYWGQLDE